MADLYVLIDLERSIGTGIVHFWKDHSRGYTRKPGEAGKYSQEDAHDLVMSDVNNRTVVIKEKEFEKILKEYGEA